MKKNWIMRSAYLALAVLLISTVVVSGTFAKYVWTVTSDTESAKVAKFAFTINGSEIDGATDTTFDIVLFDTINDTKDHNDEEDVDDTLIAPGTEGSFVLNFENKSEVTVALEYAVVAFENADVPILFQVGEGADWKDTLDVEALSKDTIKSAQKGGAAVDQIVNWKWDFTDTDPRDADDTALGFAANTADVPEVTLQIKATVTQVD